MDTTEAEKLYEGTDALSIWHVWEETPGPVQQIILGHIKARMWTAGGARRRWGWFIPQIGKCNRTCVGLGDSTSMTHTIAGPWYLSGSGLSWYGSVRCRHRLRRGRNGATRSPAIRSGQGVV